jgi:hypothetical protein
MVPGLDSTTLLQNGLPIKIDSMEHPIATSVLAPHAVILPSVVVAVQIHNRDNDELCFIQDGGNLVVIAIFADKVMGEVLD